MDIDGSSQECRCRKSIIGVFKFGFSVLPATFSGVIRLSQEIKACKGFRVIHCDFNQSTTLGAVNSGQVFYLSSASLARKTDANRLIIGSIDNSVNILANYVTDVIYTAVHQEQIGSEQPKYLSMKHMYETPQDIDQFDWNVQMPGAFTFVAPIALEMAIEFFV